jgi:hypothetical protein
VDDIFYILCLEPVEEQEGRAEEQETGRHGWAARGACTAGAAHGRPSPFFFVTVTPCILHRVTDLSGAGGAGGD